MPLEFVHVSLCNITLLEECRVRAVPRKVRFYGELCPSLLPSLPLVFAHVSLCSLTLLEKFVVRAVPHKISVLRRA